MAARLARLSTRLATVEAYLGVDEPPPAAAGRGLAVPAAPAVPAREVSASGLVGAKKKEVKVDIYRDTLLRYAGYANEVGEAFRPMVPRWVLPSYGVAIVYVIADAQDKTRAAYQQSKAHTPDGAPDAWLAAQQVPPVPPPASLHAADAVMDPIPHPCRVATAWSGSCWLPSAYRASSSTRRAPHAGPWRGAVLCCAVLWRGVMSSPAARQLSASPRRWCTTSGSG